MYHRERRAEAGMKRASWFGGLAGAVLLIGQGEDPRVFVNFQEVMIPMRDGVKLETAILTPKNAKGALPFLIDRTPYGVPGKEATAVSYTHLRAHETRHDLVC